MKQKDTKMINTVFVGENIKQMAALTVHLADKKFDISLKKAESTNPDLCKKTYYKILVSADQHDKAFDEGVYYCIEHDFDNIICGDTNKDYDIIRNIKNRHIGLGR